MIIDIVYGFLGAGKTTFIQKILQEWGKQERIVVLVNEFGELGIDGDLLSGIGGQVVEMPSGCICCTIQSDFKTQMLEISSTIHPDRVIVEPTGVATITQIRPIFQAELFEGMIRSLHGVLVADASDFFNFYKANRHFLETQVQNADLVLLNKCDRIDPNKIQLTHSTLSSINPEITVLNTEFGTVDWAEYHTALSLAKNWAIDRFGSDEPGDTLLADTVAAIEAHGQHREDPNDHGRHHVQDTLGYETFGKGFSQVSFDQEALERLFRDLNDSKMGQVVRAKGIFKINEQWILMELASRSFSSQIVRAVNQSKVTVIGTELERDKIDARLSACVRGAIL